MKEIVKRIIGLTVGWFFIVLGIIGLFLPILQGALFIFIGLVILSRASKTVHNLLERLKERYPRFGYYLDAAKEKVREWKRKILRRDTA